MQATTSILALVVMLLLATCATSVPLVGDEPAEQVAVEIQALDVDGVSLTEGQLDKSKYEATADVAAPVAIIQEENKPALCLNIGQYCQLHEQCCSKRCLTYAAKCVS